MPIYIEPGSGVSPILQVIKNAHQIVHLNVYYLSDRPILNALKMAHERGVKVDVIIDGKPYGMKPWKVAQEEKRIAGTGAVVKLAPGRFESSGHDYRFDHAKYVCNGSECEIGTANFDWSAFHKNREYLYVTQNPTVVKAANAVFSADWSNQRAPAYAHQVLVLSPGTSAAQLIQVISQPGTVDMESEEMGPYQPILNAIARKGKLARVILPANINAEGKRDVAFLKQHGVQVRLLPIRPRYMHAKMIVGSAEGFVGSENYTQTSLESNREIGLLLDGQSLGALRVQFEKDWNAAGG